ncbi:hypothetical protein [uncultured Dysosmobacter sp.]|uniref:hypothetical protein n=1 Tax=uncultured Dysosmobacter sp. TaxID=2591384 RepID=UPI00260491D4|nr:hypothetical protein [uncultured Dysosmobacter sp.]
MTIGAWIVAGIIGFTGLIIAGVLAWSGIRGSEKSFVVCGIAAALITALVCAAFVWWRSNSESGKRALKDQQSNLNGGIERTVRVFDINGNLIEQYCGKFDIETDRASYILFDDEQGDRHMIYYTTGTIIVDEN